MNSALHIAKKLELWAVIKRLGSIWAEDESFIAQYAKDVYIANKDDLEQAIKCFRELVWQGEWIGTRKR